MIIDFHTHKSETAEGIYAIRSFCITEINEPINIPHSIGLHPWNNPQSNWLELLKIKIQNPNCLFIGECGLDKLKGDPIKTQIQRFKEQITLSEEIHKPLVIHCVKSYNEIIEIHKEMQPTQKWIVHGFRGTTQLAQQLLAHNIYVSLGTYIANPKQTKMITIVKQLGLGNFMLETDNNPTHIYDLYKSVAETLETTLEELTSKIDNLFVSLQKI